MFNDRRPVGWTSRHASDRPPTTPAPAATAAPARTVHRRAHAARTTLAAAAAAAVLAALLSGCGSSAKLNTSTVEHAIAASILAQRHAHVTVACPSNVAQRAGVVFTCTANLQAGKYPVTVTQLNNIGYVRYRNPVPLLLLDTSRVENSIVNSIATQRRLHATVTCPHEVLQHTGVAFTCTATVKGVRYPFEVTQVDGRGNVRYVGR
jgi:hypothetical protein